MACSVECQGCGTACYSSYCSCQTVSSTPFRPLKMPPAASDVRHVPRVSLSRRARIIDH